ncbi:ap-3 complex subunit delta-1 [Anaeramoeba flamelloides]|uniref:Ap-3 complex subunit delta-1 n=1 Tax=Anaeramoeba flamelloides TaxID=1746091 RepID=A0ABQ8XP34_9EUKA|nr:ap-3 complex subunit delta-1 [Anaeramoeba flamelloides]
MGKSLTDIVRGIRKTNKHPSAYISECMNEIKNELKGTNIDVKAVAIQKLTYLQMFGQSMGFASFFMLEILPSPSFENKRIAYLAIRQSFHEKTDVLIMLTGQLKKDFISQNTYQACVALDTLSNVCTLELARNLVSDVLTMTTSNRPFLRRMAILTLYSIFIKYPDALLGAFPRLKERLDDDDPNVQWAAVNVVCELVTKTPKNFTALIPALFRKLKKYSNNWMLIKVLKAISLLTTVEKRLSRKLVEPLSEILNNSGSKSVLYEAINVVLLGMTKYKSIVKLSAEKLRIFVESSDRNLKYLGLVAYNKLMKEYPGLVAENRDIIVKCLKDDDVMIRMRALDLISNMANRQNLIDIVRKLLEHVSASEGSFQDDLIEKILSICYAENYGRIRDFEWYLNTLINLGSTPDTKIGPKISERILDVMVRVKALREYGVSRFLKLINSNIKNLSGEILYAASYCLGEFSNFLDEDEPRIAIEYLLQPRSVTQSPRVQALFLQNSLKLYLNILKQNQEDEESNGDEEILEIEEILETNLPTFTQSIHLEVQERACTFLSILKLNKDMRSMGTSIDQELFSVFSEELNPVAKNAQKKVRVPKDLDLDAWINEPPKEEESDNYGSDEDEFEKMFRYEGKRAKRRRMKKEMARKRNKHKKRGHKSKKEREREKKLNPYIIKDGEKRHRGRHGSKHRRHRHSKHHRGRSKNRDSDDQTEEIPTKQLTDLGIDIKVGTQKGKSRRKPKRARNKSPDVVVEVASVMDQPEDALPSSDDEKSKKKTSELFSSLAKLDLSQREGFILPKVQQYGKEKEEKSRKDMKLANNKTEDKHKSRHRHHKKHHSSKHHSRHQKTEEKVNEKEEGKKHHRHHRKHHGKHHGKHQGKHHGKTSQSKENKNTTTQESKNPYQAFDLINFDTPKENQTQKQTQTQTQKQTNNFEGLLTELEKPKETTLKKEIKEQPKRQTTKTHSHRTGEKKKKDLNKAYQDRKIIIKMEQYVEKNEPSKVFVKLSGRTRSGRPLNHFRIEVTSTSQSSFKLIKASASGRATTKLIFSLQGIESALSAQCKATYIYPGKKAKSQVEFQFAIYPATFLIPIKIDRESLVSILRGGEISSLSKFELPSPPHGFNKYVEYLIKLLNVQICESNPKVATLYAKTINDKHAVILVNFNNNVLNINIRTSSQSYAQQIIDFIKDNIDNL